MFIEEIACLTGYNTLLDTPPVAPIRSSARAETRRSPFTLRHQLAGLD